MDKTCVRIPSYLTHFAECVRRTAVVTSYITKNNNNRNIGWDTTCTQMRVAEFFFLSGMVDEYQVVITNESPVYTWHLVNIRYDSRRDYSAEETTRRTNSAAKVVSS